MGEFQGYTIPAPGGGVNFIDGEFVPACPENDALELVNLYPINATKVGIRGGLQDFCNTTSASEVTSLYSLSLQDASTKLVAATNNKFYEVSTGTASDITGSTTPTSNSWNATQFGNRLWMCNGTDLVQVYNGSTISDSPFTGITSSSLINVNSYKERLYFIEENSGSAWYGGVKSVSGSLTEVEFDYYLKRGGYLLSCGSWTNQLASTSADLFYVCSSEGEILCYQGTHPGDTATPWALVARFVIGKPLGYRAFVRVDNDLWIITEQGIVPMSLLFSGGSTVALNSIGRKINSFISRYARSTPFSHRWHGLHWTQGRRVYINVPVSNTNSKLLVCNTDTGAWCTYEYTTAGSAISMAARSGLPYFGASDGYVRKAETNLNDDGVAIPIRMRMSSNFFGSRGNFKKFKDIRPLMYTLSGVTLSLTIETNFQQTAASTSITTTSGTSGSTWDDSDWDTTDWGDEAQYYYDRYSLRGQGHSGAIRVQGSVKDVPLEFSAFEVRFEVGAQV